MRAKDWKWKGRNDVNWVIVHLRCVPYRWEVRTLGFPKDAESAPGWREFKSCFRFGQVRERDVKEGVACGEMDLKDRTRCFGTA